MIPNPSLGKSVMLVEGPDDEHVIKSICGQLKLGLIDDFRYGRRGASNDRGKQSLLMALPIQLLESDVTAVGIVLDADDDLHASWQAITHALRSVSGAGGDQGYPEIPPEPDPFGTVIPAPGGLSLLPRVGIWIMPDNRLNGALEDFLKFMVPADDGLLPHAESVIDSLPHTPFTPAHRTKALVHTWLAWQKEPGKPYGQAISARYLDTSLPEAQLFADWLRRTFFNPHSTPLDNSGSDH